MKALYDLKIMSSAHIDWIIWGFLLLNCISSFYILDTNPLSDTSFANIFSHSVGYLLLLLIVSFTVQKKLFILMKFQQFIFAFVSLALGDTSRKMLLQPISEK